MVQSPLFIAWTREALLRRPLQLAQRSFEPAVNRINGSPGGHSRFSAFQRVTKSGCRDSYRANSEATTTNDSKDRVTAHPVVDVRVYRVSIFLAAAKHVLQTFLPAGTDTAFRTFTRLAPKQNLETAHTRGIRRSPGAREFPFSDVPVFSSTGFTL